MADQARLYSADLPYPDYVDLDILAVRGASEPDSLTRFPGIIHEYLDGSLSEQIAGGRRNITIDFAIMTAAQRRKVVLWWLDPDRTVRSKLTAPTGLSASNANGGSLPLGTYHYKICGIDVIGHSAASSSANADSEATNNKINLAWTAVTGARRYKIYRSDDGGSNYDLLDYTESNSYTDDGSVTALAENVVVPSSASEISVVTTNELEFQWLDNTELHRMLTLELREDSIFTQAQQFPV